MYRKTTLLDILCNRKKIKSTEEIGGTILVNGQEREARKFVYVPQHDILLNAVTVRETLEIAALLRISNMTKANLKARVDEVLSDLGLSHKSDALVGGGDIRGLSGGERRRVSIGQEIVSSENAVLCLDEPTTGLDSTTAESVMRCLRDMAQHKGTITIATIHQPNSTITELFDDYLLLSAGSVASGELVRPL